MKPGDRVTLITKAADSLASRDWATIDLVLGQFGFPTPDEWHGAEREYVVAQLQRGDDDALVELDAYLHPGAVSETEPQPGGAEDPSSPWTTGGFWLFASHTSAEKAQISSLAKALAPHSVELFVAHDAIRPMAEWQLVIEAALRTCDALLAWLRPGFKESDWCDQEVGLAIGRDVLVIPIRYGLDPYGFIGRFQAVTVGTETTPPGLAEDIFELLLSDERSRDAMARALVWRFVGSDSFASARTNLGYLRRIPPAAWSSALKEQARTAAEENSQIRQLWVGSTSSGPSELNAILAGAGA